MDIKLDKIGKIDISRGIGITDSEFSNLRDYIYDKSGINLGNDKKDMLKARLNRIVIKRGIESYTKYLEYVKSDNTSQALVELIDAVSTNKTSFFREIRHFVFLEEVLIPELIDRKKKSGDHDIRIWSAGCSTGEEAYSIVMTLLSSRMELFRYDFKLLATDISSRVLKIAAKGEYDDTQIEGVSQDFVSRYFTKTKMTDSNIYSVKFDVKKFIQFKYLNLIQERYPFKRKFDMIFCRNVMIYFDKTTREKLIGRYYDVLDDNGYLFIGHSESFAQLKHSYKAVEPTIYKKQVTHE